MRFARRNLFLVKWNQCHRRFSSKHGNSEPLWHCPELGYRINPQEGVIFRPNGTPVNCFPYNKNKHLHAYINKSRHHIGKTVWEHCHKQYLYGHFQIVFKDGNINNIGSDNIDIEYKKAFTSEDGTLVVSKEPVTCLDGYEEMKEYPGYLINVEKGSVIDSITCIECGWVNSGYVKMSLKDGTGNHKIWRRSRFIYEHVYGKIEEGNGCCTIFLA